MKGAWLVCASQFLFYFCLFFLCFSLSVSQFHRISQLSFLRRRAAMMLRKTTMSQQCPRKGIRPQNAFLFPLPFHLTCIIMYVDFCVRSKACPLSLAATTWSMQSSRSPPQRQRKSKKRELCVSFLHLMRYQRDHPSPSLWQKVEADCSAALHACISFYTQNTEIQFESR